MAQRKLELLVGAAIAVVLAGREVHAQASPPPSPPQASHAQVEELVVTAQKREESLQEVPISVQAVPAKTVEQANITLTTGLPNLAPALTFSSGFMPGVTSFNIRGIGTYVYRAGIQPAVSVVRDGIPLARPGDFVSELVDIDRVEVLNGPQGTLFGKNATGGVINIVRKAPTAELGGYIEASAVHGRLGETETDIKGAFNVPISSALRVRLSGFRADNDSYIKNYDPSARNSGTLHAWGATAKVAWDISPDIDLLVTADRSYSDIVNGSPEILVPLQSYQQPRIPDISAKQIALNAPATGQRFAINDFNPFYQTIDLWSGDADFTWRLNPQLKLKSLTGYHHSLIRSQASFYPGAASPDNPQGFDLIGSYVAGFDPNDTGRREEWNSFTQEDRLEFTGDRLDVTGGIFFSRVVENEYSELGALQSATALGLTALVGTPTGPSAAYPYFYSNSPSEARATSKSAAAFVDMTYHLTERLKLFGGYRFSRDTLDFDFATQAYTRLPIRLGVNWDPVTHSPLTSVPFTSSRAFSGNSAGNYWSGRLGAAWDVADRVNVYASYNRSYVGVGLDLSTATAGTAANPAGALLRPSIAQSYEVGAKSELFDRRVRLNGAVFIARTTDLQVASLVAGTSTNRVQNAGDINAYGGEVTIEAHPTDHFEIDVNAAYLHTKFVGLNMPCYPGQTFANGCDVPSGASFVQRIDGLPSLDSPKWKFNIAAIYNIPLQSTWFNMYLRADYRWQSMVYYQLDHDPLATQKAYGVLNLALGLVGHNGKYELQAFIDNVADQYYCPNMVNGPLARQSCQSSPIDAQRRIGTKLIAHF